MFRIGADVYTRVDKYLDWINATITNLTTKFEKKRNMKIDEFNMDYYMNPDISSNQQSNNIQANIDTFIMVVFTILYNNMLNT